jgi:hypothetical protein
MLNPYSPPAVQGVSDASPQGYIDVPFDYVYNQTLSASQSLDNEVVSIFTEADFAWRGLIFTATGLFSVQFQDGQGYYLSAGKVFSTNMPNTPGDPFPRFPEVVYPAGGRITLNISELSADTNVVQLIFVGVNRYRIGQAPTVRR